MSEDDLRRTTQIDEVPTDRDLIVAEPSLGPVAEASLRPTTPIPNWARTVTSNPAVVARPQTVAEVRDILTDHAHFPSPVRAMGHYHSTTQCAVTEGGTVVDMTALNEIIEISEVTVKVQGGAEYLDVSKALEKYGLHFPVDLQIGNVTMGSLATCDTKDGSYPGEYGQLGAYVVSLKLATPDGELVDVDETKPELFKAVRSSYGLLGIVVEATFQVRRMDSISVDHKSFTFEQFIAALPELRDRDGSMMVYIFPFANRIIAQLRGPGDTNKWQNMWVWRVRNLCVAYGVSLFARLVNLVRISTLRFVLQQMFNAVARFILVHFLKAKNTQPTDQITNYPKHPRLACFTFSIFAFPEEQYSSVLLAYRDFCWTYYNTTSYRPDLLTVGYRVAQCDYSLFSYSAQGNVMTIDPVATGNDGWEDFAAAFNEFANNWHGKPLFNQTPGLHRNQVCAAFGDRVEAFREIREQLDPQGRMLNPYFDGILN